MDELRNDFRRMLQVSVHLNHDLGVESFQSEPEPIQKSPTDSFFLGSCQEVDEVVMTHRLLHLLARHVGLESSTKRTSISTSLVERLTAEMRSMSGLTFSRSL